MVQCERRKTQNNTKAMPPRRKAPHGLPKDTTRPGRTRPARPRFCVFAFMYFVPRRLSCGTAEETGRTAAAPGGCRGRITSGPAAYCTARKKTPPAARGRKILCVKSRCAMRLCFGVAAVFCPHGVGRPEPRPWEHPPNLSMPPASAHCRKRVISHPRHPSWRWASPWGSSASRSAVAKGPGAS